MKDIKHIYSPKIVALDKRQPTRSKIIDQLVKRQITRSSDDVAKWTQALRIAEDSLNPDRTELIRIFENIDIDGHVKGIISAIKNKIKRKEFLICDANGEELEEETAKLEAEWFFKYLDWNVEAPFYGFSLIELGDIEDDGFPDISLVPRKNVVPDRHVVKEDTFRFTENMRAIDYEDERYVDWNIFIGSKDDLGLFNTIAPTAIAKKHVMAAMWDYTEIFGMPIRQGHTNIHDPERRKNMERMLDNMGSAAWGVFDRDDEIKLVESSKGNVSVFIDPIKLANEEISKAFAGATGMFDEKSFVGSAEVQERLFSELIISYQRQIMFDANNKLLVRMKKHGIMREDARFKWRVEGNMTTKEKAAIIQGLLPFVTITPEVITEAIGIEVEATNISQEAKSLNVANKVREIYKNFDIKPVE